MASAWTLNTSQRFGKFTILGLRGPSSGNLYSQCKSFITSAVKPGPLQEGIPTVIRVTDRLKAQKVGDCGWIAVFLCICTPSPQFRQGSLHIPSYSPSCLEHLQGLASLCKAFFIVSLLPNKLSEFSSYPL